MKSLPLSDQIFDYFLELKIDFVPLYPTQTGLKKSIFDATQPVVHFLLKNGIHNYESQGRGPLHKKLVETTFIHRLGETKIKTSFYRPETKNGDARLWPAHASKFVEAGDTLALLFLDGCFLIVNFTAVGISGFEKAIGRLGLLEHLKGSSRPSQTTSSISYGQLNHAINKLITSGLFQDRELYLDFEGQFLSDICGSLSIKPEDFAEQVFEATKSSFQVYKANPFHDLIQQSQVWRLSKFAYSPPTTLFLASLSLVAEQMGASEDFGANNFYDRLIALFKIEDAETQLAIRRNFKTTVALWDDFNNWLTKNGGNYGFPTAYPIVKKWNYVSYGMSQALVRTGDKNHLKKALISGDLNPALGFDRGDVFDRLDRHLKSKAANKYLIELWKQNHIRPKIIEAAMEQLTSSSVEELGGVLAKSLKLRIIQRSYPKKSFQLSVVFEGSQTMDDDLFVKESKHSGCFDESVKIYLSPVQAGISVLSPPSAIAMDRLLHSVVRLDEEPTGSTNFVFSPRQAMALVEIEPGVYEQTNRPEIFKKHLILVQRKIIKKVENFLFGCADGGFEIDADPRGVPDDFVLVRNVTFLRTVGVEELDGDNDPNYWLRPVPTMAEIDLRGGIKLGKNAYHVSSQLQLLIASDQDKVNLRIFDLNDGRQKLNGEDLKYEIETNSGVGTFDFSEMQGFGDYSEKDIRVDVELENYKPTTINFRSSVNPREQTSEQVGFVIDEALPVGFVSATKYKGDSTILTGMRLLNPRDISTASKRHFSAAKIATTNEEFGVDENTYMQTQGNWVGNSCFVNGVHIFVFPPTDGSGNDDRVGECRNCGEVRRLPKPKKKKLRSKATVLTSRKVAPLKVLDQDAAPNTLNDLLDAVFYLQEFSWERFREICAPISNDIFFANQLLKAFATAGAVDVSLNAMKPNRIYAAPPVLLKRNGDYLLTGAFSPKLVEQVSQLVGECSYNKIGEVQGLDLYLPAFDARSIEVNLPSLLEMQSALVNGISLSNNLPDQLVRSLPNIGSLYDNLPKVSMPTKDVEKFDPILGKWRASQEVNNAGAYRQKWPAYNYFIKTVSGEVGLGNFELAKLYAADLHGVRLHDYHSDTATFRYSSGCELPLIYQRALFAISGSLPIISEGKHGFLNVSEGFAEVLFNKIYGQV